MDTQAWTKMNDKSAEILTLRGTEILKLKVSSSKFFLKKNTAKVLDALAAGTPPAEAGAQVLHTLDAREIGEVEVSPDNGTIHLRQAGAHGAHLTFATPDRQAHAIWDAIHARSGRTYESARVEISASQAVLPPILTGFVLGIPWVLIYHFSTQLAARDEVELGRRRRGMQQMMLTIADALGVNGTIGLGVCLLLALVGWAVVRLVRRPLKTVWAPAPA